MSMTENIELHINEPTNAPVFEKGMQVEYMSKGSWIPAEIMEVHYDDSPPYYTIYIPPNATGCGAKMCGCSCVCICSKIREKQTVRQKLRIQPLTGSPERTQTALDDTSTPGNMPVLTTGSPDTPATRPTTTPTTTPLPIAPVVQHHHHIRNFYPQRTNRMGMVFR